jgi:hypothetical protein
MKRMGALSCAGLIGALVAAVLLGGCSPSDDSGGPRDIVGDRSDADGAPDTPDVEPPDGADADVEPDVPVEDVPDTEPPDAPVDEAGDLPAEDAAEVPPEVADEATAPEVDATACYLDVVFVLDVSTSMTPVLGALQTGIADVWSYAAGLTLFAQFGLVVFVDDVQVTNGGAPWASAADLQAEFARWRAFCGSESEPGGSPGTNWDCPENTIDALWQAVDRFSWRAGSTRVVIFATDDTFVEPPATLGSGYLPVHHTYADLVTHLRDNQIRVAAFAAHNSDNCSIPPVHDTEPGFFAPWGGTAALPDATGARVFDVDGVRDGSIRMNEAINDVILEEFCTPYL